MSIENRKKTGFIVMMLFGGSVILRFLLGDFYPRTINCYPDELLYMSLGESLWNHHNIQVFHVASYFKKVGYSLLLSPTFAIGDIQVRGRAIALLNAVSISLGVFPLYGLAKRILSRERSILFCVVLYLISPSMTYSMTYMSENVSIPLSMLFLYLVYRVWEETSVTKKICPGILMILVMILCYVTKNVAMVFPVALVMAVLTDWLLKKERKQRIPALVSMAVVFVLAVWAGYTRFFPEGMMEKSGYVLFGFVFFVVLTLLGFCVIPVLLPGIGYKKLDEKAKKFYLLLVYIVLITAAVVACMIYTTEDYPSLTPRAHLRYVEFLFVPFVVLTWQLLEKEELTLSSKKTWMVYGIWAMGLLLVFRGFSGQTVDQTMLFYWQLIAREGRYFSLWSVKLLSLLVIVVFAVLLGMHNKKKKTFTRLLALGLILMSLGNGALSVYVQYKTHTHSSGETGEAEQLREFVQSHPTDNFLVLEPEQYCELIDTFLMDCENVRTGMEPGVTQIKETYQEPTDITYAIVCDGVYQVNDENRCVVTYPDLGYTLYAVKSKSILEP